MLERMRTGQKLHCVHRLQHIGADSGGNRVGVRPAIGLSYFNFISMSTIGYMSSEPHTVGMLQHTDSDGLCIVKYIA